MPRSSLSAGLCGVSIQIMRIMDLSLTSPPVFSFFGVPLFLIFVYTTSADGDLDIETCASKFKANQPATLCISMTREHWKYKTEICGNNDLIQILGFLLHIPGPSGPARCDTSVADAMFYYNRTLDISCLMKASSKLTVMLLQQVMEAFSGKMPSEVNSSHVMDQFIDHKLFGLPDFTLLDLNYTCFNKEEGIIPYVDMCDSVNVTDDAEIHIFFNVTSYKRFAAFPACSCVMTSASNQSLSVRAIDVRLQGDTQLRLSAADTVITDSGRLYWWQDGVLISSPGELLLDLINLDPSELPHSIWLQVTGHDLSIRCGNYSLPYLELAEVGESHVWYIAVAGISVSVVVVMVLLATLIWRCICRRSKVNKKYAVGSPDTISQENLNSRVPRKAVQNEDESIYKSLTSNVYYEVEPNYAEPQPSCSSIKEMQTAIDVETCVDEPWPNSCNNQDNIYNHLKETLPSSPVVDLYDTIAGHQYSTLQRTVPETLTNNVYNT